MSKSFRQGQILKLIRAKSIATQEELAQELKKVGVPATQVTLSRDIRDLGLAKTPDGYRQITASEGGPHLPSLAGEGGPEAAQALADYEKASGIRFDTNDVLTAAATISGFFAARAGEPDIPALPRLRWIQKLQLYPALAWICELMRVRPPAKLG